MRNKWPGRPVFTSILAFCCLAAAFSARADTRPNILILMAEDMGPRVGAFGDDIAQTPNLDRLASQGVRFPNTFTTAGVCSPSRAAHITGVHQISMGAQHMRSSSYEPAPYLAVPPPEIKAYPEILRQAGYYTFTNNKIDYQFSEYAAGTGPFTIWDYEGRDPDWNRRAEGQPFFGLVNLEVTHESRMFSPYVEESRANGSLVQVTDPKHVAVPPYYPDTAVVREAIARHYDNIHVMDRQVGEWLKRLEAEGLADNTIVIWTTDHGDGLPRAKREIYDSGIRVPLIVQRPLADESAGAEDLRLLSFVDIGPSVLTFAGLSVPAFMQGRPILANPDQERQFIHASKDRLDEQLFRERAVRDRRFKYILNYRDGEPGAKHIAYRDQLDIMAELWSKFEMGSLNVQQAFWFSPRPAEELYNVVQDPHEVSNLAGDPAYAQELTRLRAELKEWQNRVGDYSDQPESEMSDWFWPGGQQPVTAEPYVRVVGGQVQLECATPGASIAYKVDDGVWTVWSGPFALADASVVQVRAVRYGWKASSTNIYEVSGK